MPGWLQRTVPASVYGLYGYVDIVVVVDERRTLNDGALYTDWFRAGFAGINHLELRRKAGRCKVITAAGSSSSPYQLKHAIRSSQPDTHYKEYDD